MNLKPVITPHYLSLMSMYTYGSQDLREALVGASELIEKQAAEIARLRGLLTRYRKEVPMGNQPHMICLEVDEALEVDDE
jgi:hypothetical protein